MNSWKKLFLILIAGASFGVIYGDCCDNNNNNNCCSSSSDSNDCCGTDLTAKCDGGRETSKSVYVGVGFGASATYLHEFLFRNRMDKAEDGFGGAFSVTAFGGKTSDKGKNELGRRFGLCHKRCMIVAEGSDNSTEAAGRDIDPSHFNIETVDGDFKSTICFCPEQKFGGAIINYRQALYFDDCDVIRWWAEINLPIVHVEHNMGLVETIERNGGGVVQVNGATPNGLDESPRVATMKDAFKQSNWKYGKIDGCKDDTQLVNAEFKIGYNSIVGECCHLSSYIGFAAPSTDDRCAEFVFAPFAGQDHWAFMWGSEIGFEIYEWCESALHVKMALDTRYWFEKEERRSFDLKDKQWSRYMEMYKDLDAARAAATGADVRGGTSGINLMTRCVDVTPGYQLNHNAALVYEGCHFLAEIGHTLYARQAEEICPNWVEGPILKAAGGTGLVSRARTIRDQFVGSDELVSQSDTTVFDRNKIEKCDVDWNSGAHEAIIGHTIYGGLGYDFNDWCYPTLIALGGSYDFARGNSFMHRWSVFGKVGVSF